jgi:hypothetical protein
MPDPEPDRPPDQDPGPLDGEIVSPATLPALARDAAAEVDRLAARYLAAHGRAIGIVTFLGGQVEDVLGRLPAATRARIDAAVRVALRSAYGAAQASQSRRASGERLHRGAAVAFGAAGGLGGLPTALAELPVTTTMLLRSIQEIARTHGEDLAAEETRLACLHVLGAGGPLAEDDGTDFAFLGARITLTGPALNRLIAQVAPRLLAVLGPRLAAMSVPALGAIAGAGTNFAFVRYYQEMAHVHFGLRRLVRQGTLEAPAAFRDRVAQARALRRG